MSFGEAVRTCFQKYVTIEGRARRSEYWWFFLFGLIGSILLQQVDRIAFGQGIGVLSPLFGLGIFLPTLCAAIRRLHDRDMSGWWTALYLFPLFGALILLILYALPGTSGPNRFGPDPLGGSDDEDNPDAGYVQSSIPRSGHE